MQGLYDLANERDSCGIGLIANLSGKQSHAIVEQAILILKNLFHRGGAGADPTTGDGAGIMVQIPDGFFRRECDELGLKLPPAGEYGVGMFFLPRAEEQRRFCEGALAEAAAREAIRLLGWRDVPVNSAALGWSARQEQPVIRQAFFASDRPISRIALERRLYAVRKGVQRMAEGRMNNGEIFYPVSCSGKTVVYKGLMNGFQLPLFYLDLGRPDFSSAAAIVHQRYSTNTFPSWQLSQPFRLLAHNGEINTLRGNINWMRARERNLRSEALGDTARLLPIIERGGSDSACLDNVMELLVMAGRSPAHAILMLIPNAWGIKYPLGPDIRGFFEYHAGLIEPWDGPAAVVFGDGNIFGAILDRNGLRPARYTLTNDGLFVLASEAGVLDIAPARIFEKGSLRPGTLIVADLSRGRVIKDAEIKAHLARVQPYRRWVEENKIEIHGFFGAIAPTKVESQTLVKRAKLFGYTREDLELILGYMAAHGSEPIGSMGADEPLAVLSEKPQLLYWYFKQNFAQVTNPAIDPIREELVMSLMTFLGTADNFLCEVPGHARLIKLRYPILSDEDVERVRNMDVKGFASRTLSLGFPATGGRCAMEEALGALCQKAAEAVRAERRIIIITDRNLREDEAAIPALLAVSAVNTCLVNLGLRTPASIVVETGEAREVMHLALLLGYGASAVNPYLAFELISDMASRGELDSSITVTLALENYIKALCKGLLKIMSKMGISTLRSYRNAQIFEAVGLSAELVERYFPGTPSRVGGIGLEAVAREAVARWQMACAPRVGGEMLLPSGGHYRYRSDGERHLWTPRAIYLLQKAVRTGDASLYKEYARLINEQKQAPFTLRGLWRFKQGKPIPLSEVEPASSIVKRFVTGAMSFGSLSREAHETIATAMNRLGAMSNSGEGGEDPARYKPLPNGDSKCSAVKQVASGRFGVTAEYLLSARELQIKIAQGAKPGEGGQLPGHKVNAEIATTRHSTPGVTLISPPPHHDIYSIEDIAQLIYDLKRANPDAIVSVKLVSETGVGTVAAGVAKGGADKILISGYDGGTGASPLSSIRHAGLPWEIGLAETQQALIANGLRGRVRLQVDGQLKTGRDVVIGAMLGADEFGFATAVLVSLGCVMMRKCHTNMCPMGVATQDAELRKRFAGKPEHVITFMMMVVEEVREIMAMLGFRRFEEMIGRCDMLAREPEIGLWKAETLDFSRIFAKVERPGRHGPGASAQTPPPSEDRDEQILPQVVKALAAKGKAEVDMAIRNIHRAFGTRLSARLIRRYGYGTLKEDSVIVRCRGAAGQSFGAFLGQGVTLILEGEANDYVGKGLSGGKIVLKPCSGLKFDPAEQIIAGNVILYGATSGEAYICGRVGERFAVRNSGAVAVVEGVGDHGCEYMTGGRVVILGPVGVNFAAGMTGGIAYVLSPDGMLDARCNLDNVDLEAMANPKDTKELRRLIELHFQHTASQRAKRILEEWEEWLPKFVKVIPFEYKRVLGELSREDEETEREPVVND